MIDIVIDTNVFYAGLYSSAGASYKLLQLLDSNKFRYHISVPVFFEYEEVLTRYNDIFEFTNEEIKHFLSFVSKHAVQHDIYFLWRPQLKDPKDEMFLELAVSANCDYIITFNQKDFTGAEQFHLNVKTPKEFLYEIGEIS